MTLIVNSAGFVFVRCFESAEDAGKWADNFLLCFPSATIIPEP